MTFSKKQLDEIEFYSGLFFTLKDIAIILDVKFDTLLKAHRDESGEVYRSAKRGSLKAEAETRASIFKSAKNGSVPSQSQALNLIERYRLENGMNND